MPDPSEAPILEHRPPAERAGDEPPPAEVQRAAPEAPVKRASYLVRHWRGELSLGVAYWLNGVLGNITVLAVSGLINALLVDYRPVPALIGGLAIWLAFVVVTIWQVVGVWRAALRHPARGGRNFWAILAHIMVFIGVMRAVTVLATNAVPQLAEQVRIVQGDTAFAHHRLRLVRAGTELEFAGGISFGLADEIEAMLAKTPQIRVIHLNSRGGRVAEARRLRAAIAVHGLDTYVSGYCYSACAIAFMGGKNRLLGGNGQLGFHQGRFPGLTASDLARQDAIDKAALLSAGVSQSFADHAYATPNSGLWTPSAAELVEAKVVTRVAGPAEFASSRLGEADSPAEIARVYLTVPAFAAIQKATPETFDAMMQEVSDRVAQAQSDAEIDARVHARIGELFTRYAPVAGDAAIADYAEVMVEEIDQLGAKDADTCYNYITGRSYVDLGRYVDPAVTRRDLAALTKVIETGASAPQPVPDKAAVAASMHAVMEGLTATYGEDAKLLARLTREPIDHAKACRLSAEFYRGVLALPEGERGAVLRRILGSADG